jgi:diguanylate cyclase (GGDEF)-like protein
MSASIDHQVDIPEQVQRHLAQRVQLIGHRVEHFLKDGWDINGLAGIHEDCALLFNLTAPRASLGTLHHALHELHQELDGLLLQQTLPDPTISEQLKHRVDEVKRCAPSLPEPKVSIAPQRSDEQHAHVEIPPEGYWKRWTNATVAPVLVDLTAAAKVVDDQADGDPWGNNAQIYGKRVNISTPSVKAEPTPAQKSEPARRALGTLTPVPKTRSETPASGSSPANPLAAKPLAPIRPAAAAVNSAPITLKVPEGARLYHLTDSSNLSLELDQRLESQGFELEVLDDANELIELLSTIAPDLVVVDASYSDAMERIGDSIRQVRERTNKRLVLVALAEKDDVPLRLSARRAGVDALIIQPNSVQDVLTRLQQLLDPRQEAPYRILIVEDDRSQALFAEGILRNAGMESLVVIDALQVMSSLEQFTPDLILMDLHMPAANGIELTALIRERAEFVSTPIVFLSGESDQERQFDALEAGGDDFLSKPIRPRHLISAVQNRVRRHRTLNQRQQAIASAPVKDEQSHLYSRAAILQKIDETLTMNPANLGGALYMDIEAASTLRERIGLSAYENIINEVAERLAKISPTDWVCRFGDSSFLILNFDRDENGLEAQASAMRGSLMQHSFEHEGKALRLRACVGLASFSQHFEDHQQILNVIERCCREARTSDRGLRRYEPPKASHAEQEARLLHIISKAVSNQELELVYQPIVAVAGGEESQFQVLLRMRDHEGRMISAGDIIPMAERGDFILDIDRWVLIQALGLIQARQHGEKPLRLFVPQSAFTLAEPSQAQWLMSELENHNVPGTSLIIEVKLQDALMHHQPVQKFFSELTPDGVQFCLNQFEAGAENEALLERLSLGYVKLARKYTVNNNQNVIRDEMKALVDRAHRRGLEVIGSGVEDPQAAATLWISGIDFIQGNLVQQAGDGLEFDFQQAVL